MSRPKDDIQFADSQDVPVRYMQRLRDYYLALGYDNPYRWAQYAEVPFCPLDKSLSESRVGLVTTAAPFKPDAGEQGARAPYNAAAKFYQVYSYPSDQDQFLGISHLGYDRVYSSAEDINAFFPLEALRQAAARGRIGEVGPRYYGAPTNRSQATTVRQDCDDILFMMQEDEVDLAILVPS